MTDDEKREMLRRYNEGLCAMSDAQMAARYAEQAAGMRNASPDYSGGQAAMNFWTLCGSHDESRGNFIQDAPRPTLFERFKRWILACRS